MREILSDLPDDPEPIVCNMLCDPRAFGWVGMGGF